MLAGYISQVLDLTTIFSVFLIQFLVYHIKLDKFYVMNSKF